jgi:hypothetical protein
MMDQIALAISACVGQSYEHPFTTQGGDHVLSTGRVVSGEQHALNPPVLCQLARIETIWLRRITMARS